MREQLDLMGAGLVIGLVAWLIVQHLWPDGLCVVVP